MPKSEHPHFEKPKNKCLNEREKHSWQQGMKKKTADEETEIEFTYSSKQRVIKMKTQNQFHALRAAKQKKRSVKKQKAKANFRSPSVSLSDL